MRQNENKNGWWPSPWLTDWPANGIICLFSRSVLIGTPVDFKRFYLDSVPWQRFITTNIWEAERFIGHWLPKKRGKTCKSIFPQKHFLIFLWDPTLKRQYPKSPPPPPKKNLDWVDLFEICLRSSKMTDPRPCPTGWANFKALSCSTKTYQAQINNKFSIAKIDIF